MNDDTLKEAIVGEVGNVVSNLLRLDREKNGCVTKAQYVAERQELMSAMNDVSMTLGEVHRDIKINTLLTTSIEKKVDGHISEHQIKSDERELQMKFQQLEIAKRSMVSRWISIALVILGMICGATLFISKMREMNEGKIMEKLQTLESKIGQVAKP